MPHNPNHPTPPLPPEARLRSRIAAAARRPDFRPTHAGFEGGSLTTLHCKRCNAKIAGLVGRVENVTLNGRRAKLERMVFTYFANYREALLQFEDGSKHVTSTCVDCAPQMIDPAVAEAVYAMDLSQWLSEGANTHPRYIDRQSPKLVRYASRIEG